MKAGRLLTAIFVAALTLRIAASLTAPVFYGGDDVSYDEYAKIMVEKHELYIDGRISSFRPPLYIMFMAFIYSIFGQNFMLIKIIQSAIGALTCLAIYQIGKDIISEKAGVISAAIAAIYVSFIYSPAHILTETIYTFLFTVSVMFFAKNERHADFKWQALAGLSLGLASLTKGTPQLFPACMFFFMILKALVERASIKKTFMQFVVICLFFLLPIIPWTVRNFFVHKNLVMITTETGEAFYSAYHPPEGKRFGFSTVDDTKKKWSKINQRSETEGSKFLIEENLKFIRQNPLHVAKLTVLKVAFMWSPFDWEIMGGNGVYNFSYGFIVPFMIIGVAVTIMRKMLYSLLLYLPIVYSQGIGVAFDASPRYRLPVEPFLIVIAAIGVIYIYNRFVKHKAAVIFVMAVFFAVNFTMFLFSGQVKTLVRGIFQAAGLW